MKKLLLLTAALALLSCNSNEKQPSEENPTKVASNLELAKSTIDQIFETADYWENKSEIKAPYGSKLNIQLKTLKSKLTAEELKELNEYAHKRFDKEYPQS